MIYSGSKWIWNCSCVCLICTMIFFALKGWSSDSVTCSILGQRKYTCNILFIHAQYHLFSQKAVADVQNWWPCHHFWLKWWYHCAACASHSTRTTQWPGGILSSLIGWNESHSNWIKRLHWYSIKLDRATKIRASMLLLAASNKFILRTMNSQFVPNEDTKWPSMYSPKQVEST